MKAASLLDPNLVVTTSVRPPLRSAEHCSPISLPGAPDIDAVFCVNDDLALGVLFECQRRRSPVPGDMAIVGFNDLEFTASAVPSLTSVRTNRYEMGGHAVTMVIDAIEGRRPREPVIDLGFQLMVRESSTPQSTLMIAMRPA